MLLNTWYRCRVYGLESWSGSEFASRMKSLFTNKEAAALTRDFRSVVHRGKAKMDHRWDNDFVIQLSGNLRSVDFDAPCCVLPSPSSSLQHRCLFTSSPVAALCNFPCRPPSPPRPGQRASWPRPRAPRVARALGHNGDVNKLSAHAQPLEFSGVRCARSVSHTTRICIYAHLFSTWRSMVS